jgi:hypothetical protein
MRKSSIMLAVARPGGLRPFSAFSSSLSIFGCVLGLAGCPPSTSTSGSADASATEPVNGGRGAAGACARVGQSCEVSPGKLGTCVQKDDCPGAGPCFVCQSQH